LEASPFEADVSDLQIVAAFKQACAVMPEDRDTARLLLDINDASLREDAIAALATTPTDKYYKIFKESSGDNLRRMIAGALQFDRLQHASPSMLQIAKRAKEALMQLGRESDINASRVRRFGIITDTNKSPFQTSSSAL
jgi:hypothetical protein